MLVTMSDQCVDECTCVILLRWGDAQINSIAFFTERYAVGNPPDTASSFGCLFNSHHRTSGTVASFELLPVFSSFVGKLLRALFSLEIFWIRWRPLLVSL